MYNNQTDFTPPSENGSSISAGAVAGIVVAVAIVIILVLGILWWKGCLGKKSSLEKGKQRNSFYCHDYQSNIFLKHRFIDVKKLKFFHVL